MKAHRLALVAALLAAAASVIFDGCANEQQGSDAGVATTTITTQIELQNGMRKLWTDHTTWTRVFLIDTIAGLPDAPQATRRLLQNQVDIGNAMRPFYGDVAGDQLTALLRDHITGAAAVVAAAQSGDAARFATARTAWYANADLIAAFLASINQNWREPDLQALMHTHLDQTLAEANAQLTHDWNGDIAAYDAVVTHILRIADTLTAGIAKQFPDSVAATPSLSASGQSLQLAMRALWEDHVTWTRVFLIDALAGLPSTPQTTRRLLQNQVDIGNAIRPYYGDAAADQLTSLLHDHITGAAEVVAAAKAGDSVRLAKAQTAWYANADQIVALLTNANPNWPIRGMHAAMHTHLDTTLAEAVARLNHDWDGDVVAYDAVVTHILTLADLLSRGIDTQFPAGPPAH